MEGTKAYPMVVLGASFFTLFLGPSVNYATGVFHVALLAEYQEDITLTAWIGSLFCCMFALMGPVASVIINMFNCRTCVVLAGVLCMLGFTTSYLVTNIRLLFVTFGIIGGLGTGLAQTGALVVLGYYFPENTSMASGICIAGAGLGMFVHPALIQYLDRTFGLHGTFLITGGIMLNVSVCGMLMRPSPFEKERHEKVLGGLNLWRKILLSMCGDLTSFLNVATNISFIMFAFSVLFFAMAVSTIYLFLPDYFIKGGSTFQEASFAISVSGIGSICSRVLTGFASSDEKIGSFTIYTSMTGITAIITLFIPLLNSNSHSRILYGFLLGLYTGGEWVLMNTLTLDILGLEHYATGVGLVMFTCGVGYLIGPPIAGVIYENSKYYYSVFLFCVVMLFSTTLCGFLSTLKHKEQKPVEDNDWQSSNVLPKQTDFKDASEIQELMVTDSKEERPPKGECASSV